MKKTLLFSLMLSFKSFADDEILTKSQEVQNALSQSYEPNYFSMILGLFVVVGLIYLTGFLYQKLTKASFKNEDLFINKPHIISTTSIGQGRNLHIVKIGDEACMIGSTQNSITFIKDVKLQEIKKEDKNDA